MKKSILEEIVSVYIGKFTGWQPCKKRLQKKKRKAVDMTDLVAFGCISHESNKDGSSFQVNLNRIVVGLERINAREPLVAEQGKWSGKSWKLALGNIKSQAVPHSLSMS